MEVKKHPLIKVPVLPTALFAIPASLCLLFSLTKGNRDFMDFWVYQIMGPVERFWGRIWGIVPFSGMELWIASALIGSALVIWADLLGRILFAPSELPVGILMSLLGAPYFLILLCRRKRYAENA